MPNCSTNHTVFVGPKAALDDIARAITPDGEFDFNQINPTPAILSELAAPIRTVPDTEFAAKYNLDAAPTTIDELHAFITAQQFPHGLQDVPETALRAIIDTYGHDDWYNWRVSNWGTKWTGDVANTEHFHDNLLIVTYDTAWAPPTGIFTTLRANYEGLHIINGADIEGFSDGIEATEGGLTSFHTYLMISAISLALPTPPTRQSRALTSGTTNSAKSTLPTSTHSSSTAPSSARKVRSSASLPSAKSHCCCTVYHTQCSALCNNNDKQGDNSS